MTCDQTQPFLEAFANHKLWWGTAWRVRRHLAACPACAAELTETRRLDARTRLWRDVPAPAGLQSRIAAALPSLPPVSAPRRPVVTRRAAVGLAGVAAAGVAFLWLLPGQPGSPTTAFADVEQAMEQVQTISWRTEERNDNPINHKSEDVSLVFTNWVRRNPPAIATTNFEMTPSHDFHLTKSLIDARGGFSLSKGECDVDPVLKVSAQQRVEGQIHGLTHFPQAAPSSKSWGLAQTTATNFQQRNVVVNGQRQVRFDQDIKTVWSVREGHTEYRTAHAITWADPETHRIIRVEARISKDTTGVMPFTTIIQDHFQYNQAPPKGIFDWSPPTGVRVVQMQSGPAKK